MNFIFWIVIGLIGGAVAKMLTPQEEKGGWISSIIIGMIGSIVGGFITGLLGISGGIILSILSAIGGSFLVLFVYHKYLADKWDLPI